MIRRFNSFRCEFKNVYIFFNEPLLQVHISYIMTPEILKPCDTVVVHLHWKMSVKFETIWIKNDEVMAKYVQDSRKIR